MNSYVNYESKVEECKTQKCQNFHCFQYVSPLDDANSCLVPPMRYTIDGNSYLAQLNKSFYFKIK